MRARQRECPNCYERMNKNGEGRWHCSECGRRVRDPWARLDDDEELRLVKWIRDNTSLKAEYRNKELAKKELAMVRQSQKSLEALSSYWHPSRHTSTRSWQDARAAEEVFKFPGVPIPFSRGSLQDCITDCITRLWWRAYALKRTPYPSWTDGEQWVLWTLAHIIVHSRGRQKDAPNWPHIQELFTAARLQRTSEDLRQSCAPASRWGSARSCCSSSSSHVWARAARTRTSGSACSGGSAGWR